MTHAASGTRLDGETAEQQARVLAQALPFLRRYAGATIVVKYGGHAMGDAKLAETFGADIALLKQVGVNPVVVHGGGPQINDMLERLKITSTFVDGLRVIDAAMVEVVEMVLAGTVNKQVAGLINRCQVAPPWDLTKIVPAGHFPAEMSILVEDEEPYVGPARNA